jgi:glycosyltransferase involved in cell wall biosynthesis
MKISAVLNTYNASEYLSTVLEKLKGFDEIVVCDMESTDDTLEIARNYGCKIVNFPKGNITICEPARNLAIQSASNEWVLVVDADEIITEQLRYYLYEIIKSPDCPDALFIPRKNYVLNSYNWSSYPDYQCRFMRKSKANWPPTIHSVPVINGCVGHIPKGRKDLAIIHYSHSMAVQFQKMCAYTDNEVERRKGKHITFARLIFEPLFRFFKFYILKGGFLHGKAGYIQAQTRRYYRFMVMCKLLEHEIKQKQN